MKSLTDILSYAQDHGHETTALASLVRTQGSTYRKPGARMLITPSGRTIGVLSGGCLEEIIATDGLNVLTSGQPCLRSIDTRQYFGCDGKLEILVERIPPAGDAGNVLTKLAVQMARRSSAYIATRFKGSPMGTRLLDELTLVEGEEEVFSQVLPIPIRLLVFGRGPEIRPLMDVTAMLGWSLVVFDHPSECTAEYRGDPFTAALIMNHHFGRDTEALVRVLSMNLPYVALLGPRRRTNQLLGQLMDTVAVLPSVFDTIHSPAGLDIGSETPEEIILSIASEVLAVLSGHEAGFLRSRNETRTSMAQFIA